MAKQPVTRDRYRLHAETSMEEFGSVLAELTKMGLQNIGYELITDVRSFTTNPPRTAHDVKAEDFILSYIDQNPTFVIKDLIKKFRDDGRTDGAGYTGVRILVEKGVLKKLGPGNYQHTNVKSLPAPKPSAKTKPPTPKTKRGQGRRYEIGNREFLFSILGDRKKFKTSDFNDAFEKDGRPTKSISSVIAQLTSDKVFKKLGEGAYEVNDKHKKSKKKSAAPVAAASMNGATPHGVDANG